MKLLATFLVPMVPSFAIMLWLGDAPGTKEVVGGVYFVCALPLLIWCICSEATTR